MENPYCIFFTTFFFFFAVAWIPEELPNSGEAGEDEADRAEKFPSFIGSSREKRIVGWIKALDGLVLSCRL